MRDVRAVGILKLYSQQDSSGEIILMICKLSDEFHVAGRTECSRLFIHNIGMQFIVRSVASRSTHSFDGCKLQMLDDENELSMEKYWKRLDQINVSSARKG